MTEAWKAPSADERMLPIRQRAHDEKVAVAYFENAIRAGHAHQLLADLNMLDDMLRELGMQDTDDSPAERIRALMKPNS